MAIVMKNTAFALLAVAIVLGVSTAARADEPKVRISFGAGVTAGAIDGSAAFTASAGYRFADHMSFEVEAAYVDSPADQFANRFVTFGDTGAGAVARVGNLMANQRGGQFGQRVNIALPVEPALRVNNDGNTLLTTMGFRYELPSQDTRFRPYVSGGMGVSRTDEHFNIAIAATTQGRPGTPTSTNTVAQQTSHTGLLASAGAGASIRLVKQLSVDVDARYYRLDRARNLGRFGGGFSYRF